MKIHYYGVPLEQNIQWKAANGEFNKIDKNLGPCDTVRTGMKSPEHTV